ncbi:MAG: hypothetical protein AAF376_16955, partial [Pseudomonadota bacterium]
MAVGIFDSGLGGLTVLDAVQARSPDLPLVYFGDNAHTPYGVRDADDIYEMKTAGVTCALPISALGARCHDLGR